MKKSMMATGPLTYGTRRLRSGDEFTATSRDARLLVAIGKARYAPIIARPAAPTLRHAPLNHDSDWRRGGSVFGGDDLKELRALYSRVVGKRAFAGWDAAELRRRIAEAG